MSTTKTPYKLTLTYHERQAIDWIGYRYSHGNNLRDILDESMFSVNHEYGGDEWFVEKDIEFQLSEYFAQQIVEIGKECNYLWDCFSREFTHKMNQFCHSVV